MASEFETNPCRCSLFDVFHLDKAVTDIRAIREAIRDAKNRQRFDSLTARDGTPLQLTEAQLNNLEKRLLDPIERLKEEQLVHQAYLFGQDEALKSCVDALAASEDTTHQVGSLLSDTRTAVLQMISRFLPPLEPPQLADDLPWPEPPATRPAVREDLAEAILRDQ
jgi:hypothetical protein